MESIFPSNIDYLLWPNESLYQKVSTAIAVHDLTGKIIFINKVAEEVLGYTIDELKGKDISVLIPGSKVEEERIITKNFFSGQPNQNYSTLRKCKNGIVLELSDKMFPIINPENKVIGFLNAYKNLKPPYCGRIP